LRKRCTNRRIDDVEQRGARNKLAVDQMCIATRCLHQRSLSVTSAKSTRRTPKSPPRPSPSFTPALVPRNAAHRMRRSKCARKKKIFADKVALFDLSGSRPEVVL